MLFRSQVHGPRAGIEAVEAIQNRRTLDSYYLFYAVIGEFEAQLNNFQSAANHLRKAIRLTELKSEQSLLSKRLQDCEEEQNPQTIISQSPMSDTMRGRIIGDALTQK